jgi:hypothetical protein
MMQAGLVVVGHGELTAAPRLPLQVVHVLFVHTGLTAAHCELCVQLTHVFVAVLQMGVASVHAVEFVLLH